MPDKNELEGYIDDLRINRQGHENDDPLEMAAALIYAIQTKEDFNIDFAYFLKNVTLTEKKQIKDTIQYRRANETPSKLAFMKDSLRVYPKTALPKQMNNKDVNRMI